MTSNRASSAYQTVLLTGASGVVGQAMLPKLTDCNLCCLVHRRPVDRSSVVSLQGDLLQPRLGLSANEFRELASRVDCVIHSAAITDFFKAEKVIFDTNIEGTKNILEFAAEANAPFYYVSTAFVHPTSTSAGGHEANAYEVSKRAAEEVVRTSGVPATILRPSIIVGDSQTGVIAQFQGLHHVAGLFLNGLLPVIPGSPDAYVDFVPNDLVADAIIGVAMSGQVGGEYFISSGPQAMTVGQLVELCADNSEQLMGRAVARPKFVTQDVFDRLIKPVFLPQMPGLIRRTVERSMQLARYLNIEEPFPTSVPELEREFGVQPPPSPAQTFLRSLEYWARVSPFKERKGQAA